MSKENIEQKGLSFPDWVVLALQNQLMQEMSSYSSSSGVSVLLENAIDSEIRINAKLKGRIIKRSRNLGSTWLNEVCVICPQENEKAMREYLINRSIKHVNFEKDTKEKRVIFVIAMRYEAYSLIH